MDFHDRRHWWTVAQCGAAWWGMSPPCQDYCGSGTRKSLNGERGWTSLEILLGIVLCGPKGFVFENSARLSSTMVKHDPLGVYRMLLDNEYEMRHWVDKAEKNLPQSRHRTFLIALRKDKMFLHPCIVDGLWGTESPRHHLKAEQVLSLEATDQERREIMGSAR